MLMHFPELSKDFSSGDVLLMHSDDVLHQNRSRHG